MRIIEDYIKEKKRVVDKDNEQEYIKILDIITTGKPLLKDYNNYLLKRIKELL